MFVVIDKSRLRRLIALTRDDRRPRQQGQDGPFIRIEAADQTLKLTGREVEVILNATVHEPGVLFLRVTLFRRLLAVHRENGFLAIQANAEGISFGDTRLAPAAADMLLYPDPVSAPQIHPAERGDMPEQNPLPRQMDLFGFREGNHLTAHPTTQTGYTNVNGQRNDGCLGLPGTDHNQVLYRMTCTRCSKVYAANGSDIHGRKCPACQGGAASSGDWKP